MLSCVNDVEIIVNVGIGKSLLVGPSIQCKSVLLLLRMKMYLLLHGYVHKLRNSKRGDATKFFWLQRDFNP